MDYSPPGFSVQGIFPDKNTGVSCHFLLQGFFPTQGLNPGLLHWQSDSLPVSHQGSFPAYCHVEIQNVESFLEILSFLSLSQFPSTVDSSLLWEEAGQHIFPEVKADAARALGPFPQNMASWRTRIVSASLKFSTKDSLLTLLPNPLPRRNLAGFAWIHLQYKYWIGSQGRFTGRLWCGHKIAVWRPVRS